jgi:hypothetical protein
MTRCLAWAAGCLLATSMHAATNDAALAELEGRQLARQLSELRPAENSFLSGVLKIFPSRNTRIEVPAEFQTVVTATNWQVVYRASGTNQENAMSVTIIHMADRPNQYRLAQPGQSSCEANAFTLLTGDQTMMPFAGSDFWLADLGLEFFSWPKQKILKKELRSGQSCSVLESANPSAAARGYARVVSWIDTDTGGIVYAEAYDAKGGRLKKFEPKALKKVNGQWQLQEMLIRNLKTGSRTAIEFNLQAK